MGAVSADTSVDHSMDDGWSPDNARPLFAFDLDGTITACEILPRLAQALGIAQEIEELTCRTLDGSVSFEQSFRRRFTMLKNLPVHEAQAIIAAIPLNRSVASFIRQHSEFCIILTGNLDIWIRPLMAQLGCAYCCSTSLRSESAFALTSVLDKGAALRDARSAGPECRPIVAIGDSMNDVPMFKAADIGIAFGGVHTPAKALLQLATHIVWNEQALCRLLSRFLPQARTHDSQWAG